VKVRVIKADLSGVELQLSRIADLLEGILRATDPLQKWEGYAPMEDEPVNRVFVNNEDEEIVQTHLRRLGREYKPSIAKK
jgi:hypothetical protein